MEYTHESYLFVKYLYCYSQLIGPTYLSRYSSFVEETPFSE